MACSKVFQGRGMVTARRVDLDWSRRLLAFSSSKERPMTRRFGLGAVLCLEMSCSTSNPVPPAKPSTPAQKESGCPCQREIVVEDRLIEVPDRLTVTQIQSVIAEAAPRVKRSCWQPALDERAVDAPTNVRIVVFARIDRSGAVLDVKTSEAPPAYPNLASCVEKIVRGLTFPRASDETTTNIPFVFDVRDGSQEATAP
jgi:hypothetical protein